MQLNIFSEEIKNLIIIYKAQYKSKLKKVIYHNKKKKFNKCQSKNYWLCVEIQKLINLNL